MRFISSARAILTASPALLLALATAQPIHAADEPGEQPAAKPVAASASATVQVQAGVKVKANADEEAKPAAEKQPAKPNKEKQAKEKPAVEKPKAEKPAVDKPAPVKPAAEKPAAEQPVAVKPAAPVDDRDNPIPRLMNNLQSENVNVAASAARSLGVVCSPDGKTGAEAKPVIAALIEKLKSPQGAVLRRESATALGNIRAKESLDGLADAMTDEDVEVAMAAGNAVAKILPVDEARAYLQRRGSEEAESVKVAAYDAMAPIAKPEDVEFLSAGLNIDNWRIQMAAVKGLEKAVRAGANLDSDTYDQIAAVLGNEITNAASAAMMMLSNIRNEECVRAAIAAADIRGDGGPTDTTWRNRTWAIRSLNRMGWPTNRPAVNAVIRQLGDPTSNVSGEARSLLAGLRKNHYVTQDSLLPLFIVELEKAEPTQLRAAIMREIGSHVPQQYASRVAGVASRSLDDGLEDKDAWLLRANSITLLGASGWTGSMEQIASCVGDDVPNVRNAAGSALEQLSGLCTDEQRAVVSPLLRKHIEKTLDWRKSAVAARAAGAYPDVSLVEPLVLVLSHSVINVKDSAAHSLAKFAEGDDAELREAVNKQTHAELATNELAWEYGARVLGAVGDAKSIPLLTTILQRGHWRAQSNAATAVAAIAKENKINDKALTEALIKVAQSDILQVQDAANLALRNLAANGGG